MDYEVVPEPTGDEGEALARVLDDLLGEETHPAYESAWRRAGIVESTGSDNGALAE